MTEIKHTIRPNGKKFAVVLRRKGYSRTCYIGQGETQMAAVVLAAYGIRAATGDLEAFSKLPEIGQKNLTHWGEWATEGDDETADS